MERGRFRRSCYLRWLLLELLVFASVAGCCHGAAGVAGGCPRLALLVAATVSVGGACSLELLAVCCSELLAAARQAAGCCSPVEKREAAMGRGGEEREGAEVAGRFLPAAHRWSWPLCRSHRRIRGWGWRLLFKGEEEE
ncbi:hypothetical protein AABB24_014026 [Solanum stoloniferum]|uniref:Uncharacterized protein n=1 Tax=Solanum stoloniferum TaxID=62892 RepID=A0ABD2TWR4_9SOLN